MGEKLAKIVLTLGLPFLLAANCEDTTTIKMQTEEEFATNMETTAEKIGERYKIIRVGTFEDDLAYDNKRGIYEIIDTKTGREYFGISGIGITEVGSHSSGNNTIEDER
jgi:hypothetical protein